MGKQIEILDTTLRDGAQARGISFSVEDKLNIAASLDLLGVSYIEFGNPATGSGNWRASGACAVIRSEKPRCGVRRHAAKKDTPVAEDAGVRALEASGADTVVISESRGICTSITCCKRRGRKTLR